PLALLVILLVALAGGGGLAAAAWGASTLPLTLALAALTALTVGVGAAWWTFGREVLPPRRLLAVPGYVAWKLPIYARLAVSGAERRWVRTTRSPVAAVADHGEAT